MESPEITPVPVALQKWKSARARGKKKVVTSVEDNKERKREERKEVSGQERGKSREKTERKKIKGNTRITEI
jgi:Flp pilus assembly protein TadB